MSNYIHGRLAYPHLTEAYAYEGKGVGKYEATLIIDPAEKTLASYREVLAGIAQKKFGSRAQSVLAARPAIRSGNDREKVPAGFKDMLYLAARTSEMPQFFDPSGNEMSVEQAETTFYPGCYVNMFLAPYAYDKKGNRGISHELVAVQFVSDGPSFNSRPVLTAADMPKMGA